MMAIIGGRSCATCKFMSKRPDGAMQCRLNPPTAQLIVAPGPDGQPVHLATVSDFPPVNPDAFCHKHERGLAP